ncbi:hypothetical protein [Breznakiella homolactica]|uniref:Uncharacterized protein n=1 Tax=Breznakiella homolactica TaxID=2798577 RepID=A0A7T7XML7_9SPIR|nr:hypothetical protein [Breznakiella homolactica]QQO09007.1 hypothetical protein JFL75_19070 [Breznakiella homolactica]
MSQYGILRHCYETLFGILSEVGSSTGLFDVRGGVPAAAAPEAAGVFLIVTDVAQVSQDKNGEKVFVDEKTYPAPTYVAFIAAVTVISGTYPALLEAAGCIIRYFKDHNTFSPGDYNWHGNSNDTVYIEPVIREPIVNRPLPAGQAFPAVTIEYRIEAAVNSEKGGEFRRVQKTDIRSKTVE